MAEPKRPTLSLSGLVRADEDGPLYLATYDVLLPCRKFAVEHKIAVLGRISLTGEFLLRLLRAADGVAEDDGAAFFGFDQRDMAFVIHEVEKLGYVERKEGRLWLTIAGRELFRPGSDQPHIFEVEARREIVGFDLMALAPEDQKPLDDFEQRLPELELLEPALASAAAAQIPTAFRRFYPEIMARRERAIGDKRSLYSIDEVTPKSRFSSLVRIAVRSTGLRPSAGEPDLGEWRDGAELDDRRAVAEAVSAFVDGLRVDRRSDDAEAYDVLAALAPEFLKDVLRKDGLAVERYYREAFTRAGEPRSDRPTIPLLGTIFTGHNVNRTLEVLDYGLRSQARPEGLIWISPTAPSWGATQRLPELAREIKARCQRVLDGEGARAKAIGFLTGRPEPYVEMAFDDWGVTDTPQAPGRLELMIVPEVMVAASVHAPIGASRGIAVPLGLLSFDPRVVQRAQAYAAPLASRFVADPKLLAAVDQMLAEPAPT